MNSTALPIQYLDESDESPCLRCKEERSVLISRKEHFCKECFIRFIRGKQRRQMQDEKYRVKYGEVSEKLGSQRVLLAFSGGITSLVLLDVIGSLLQQQYEAHRGRQGFELVVVHLDENSIKPLDSSVETLLDRLIQQYAPASITYKVVPLNSYVLDDDILQKLVMTKHFEVFSQATDERYTLEQILSMCPNKSSVEDLLTVVYEELIVRTAYENQCQTILYGHNMTRIGNEVISLTVKGRGSTIYQAVSDHQVHFKGQDIQIIFPLRELIAAEIVAYASLQKLLDLEVKPVAPKSTITKNMTIREITTQYFHLLDNSGYSSTASTVMRTADKLGPPKSDEDTSTCQICGVEIHKDPKGWLKRITVSDAAPIETEEELKYAQEYRDHFGDIELENSENTPLSICYGCTVSLGGISSAGFVWPTKTQQQEKEDILNEYTLSED